MARTASAAAPASAPAVATAPVAAAAAAAPPLPYQVPGTSNGPEKMGESGHQQAARDVTAKQQPSDVKVEPTSHASSPANRPVAGAAQAGAGAAPGNAPNLRGDPHPALDAAQPISASSQQQLKPAGKLPVAKAPHAIPSTAGTAGQPHGDSVRGKAVAILRLALTSPTDLTPQEAAVALEPAVFARFAEHGEPGMRSVTPAHCLQIIGMFPAQIMPYPLLTCFSMPVLFPWTHLYSLSLHILRTTHARLQKSLQTALNALTQGAYDLYSTSSSVVFLSSQH